MNNGMRNLRHFPWEHLNRLSNLVVPYTRRLSIRWGFDCIETLERTKLPAVSTPREHLPALGPTTRRGLAGRHAPHHLLLQHPIQLLRHRLYQQLFPREPRRGRRVDYIAELGEAVEAPAEHFACFGDGEGMILPERDACDRVWERGGREGREVVLRVGCWAQSKAMHASVGYWGEKRVTYRPPEPNPQTRKFPRVSSVTMTRGRDGTSAQTPRC